MGIHNYGNYFLWFAIMGKGYHIFMKLSTESLLLLRYLAYIDNVCHAFSCSLFISKYFGMKVTSLF